MLKGVLVGLLILVLCVFAYVGYTSYSVGLRSTVDDSYSGASPTPQAEAKSAFPDQSSSLPPTPTTAGGGSNAPLNVQPGVATGGAMPPANDSITPQPPNGMTFGGSGHYQLYRQGDLTWRLNTDNGQTCVLFATDEEWRKPKVYRAGCGKQS